MYRLSLLRVNHEKDPGRSRPSATVLAPPLVFRGMASERASPALVSVQGQSEQPPQPTRTLRGSLGSPLAILPFWFQGLLSKTPQPQPSTALCFLPTLLHGDPQGPQLWSCSDTIKFSIQCPNLGECVLQGHSSGKAKASCSLSEARFW